MNAPEFRSGPLVPTLIGCGEPPATPAPRDVGFKASNLARMSALGLPVPPAFVLGTAWCARREGMQRSLWQPALGALERSCALRFGDARRPLLLSVRSGAPVSMPGMMETLLNVGLCDATLPGLLRLTGNPRLAWDAYRRLVAGFGEVVLGIDGSLFEADVQRICAGRDERELDFAELRTLTRAHQATVSQATGRSFPQDPMAQLEAAIEAVFASWQAPKARNYRQLNHLADDLGTAVTVQRMVFGNAGGTSGAGVGFTRHPSTGEAFPWVDFLFNAQGEDVVSGRRSARGHDELASAAPQVWAELVQVVRTLEQAFGDMQDFEFTVENGRLWMLQTRSGKRTVQARARIALDLHAEGIIDRAEALRRTDGLDAAALSSPEVVTGDGQTLQPLCFGVSAAHGVATGEIALDEARARSRHAAGHSVLLLRRGAETCDIVALDIASGLLTARGARTSHAAVVARELGKVCLVGCDRLEIDLSHRKVRLADADLAEGAMLTLDGNTGAIFLGVARTVQVPPTELLQRLDSLRRPPVAG